MVRWNDPMPEELARRPEFLAARRSVQLEEINRTIQLAEVRCVPFDEFLARVERLWDDPASNEIVYRACEEPLSHNQLLALAQSVKRLADSAENLPSASKASVDRAIKQMLSRLPAELVMPIAMPWLEHKRKFRRQIAYRVFRGFDITAELGRRLFAVFQRSGDQECLRLIARNPQAAAAVEAATILKLIDDEYWRMRFFQSLLIIKAEAGTSLSDSYPREFVWAAGRQKDPALLPTMSRLFESRTDDLDFLSIYAWALGQIGAKDELFKMRDLIGRMLGNHL